MNNIRQRVGGNNAFLWLYGLGLCYSLYREKRVTVLLLSYFKGRAKGGRALIAEPGFVTTIGLKIEPMCVTQNPI